ncbi:MAG: hypothetical protein HQ592_09695 [Planctomycetes bacterium]|nr:hypothetical protein [Planctomycetota bacterium]
MPDAQVLHIATDGDDGNPGTEARPFAPFARARDALRECERKAHGPISVLVHDGTYYFPEPLVLGPEDSGSEDRPITYSALPGARPVLSGGRRIDAEWKPYRNGIWTCALPEQELDFDQLFVNGRRKHRARYPNHDHENPRKSGNGYVISGAQNGSPPSRRPPPILPP